MAIPIRSQKVGPSCTGLAEFQDGSTNPLETVDDLYISSSSVLQHEAGISHNNILDTGVNDHPTIDTHLANGINHLPFPYERYYVVANAATNTTSAVPVLHTALIAPALTAGTYNLQGSFNYSVNDNANDIIISVVDVAGLNGNPGLGTDVVYNLQVETKDAGGGAHPNSGASGTNQSESSFFMIDCDLPAGLQTFNFFISSSNGATIVSCWDVRMSLTRVS